MKVNYGKAISILVVIIGLWLINRIVQGEHAKTINYKKTIDSLNTEIVKLDSTYKKQDSVIVVYKDSVAYLDKLIKVNKIEIIKIKEKYAKIRPIIIQYSNTQLDSFFSNRYGY